MPKGPGERPKKEKGEDAGPATRHIRVFADLADMIGEIIDLEGGSVANLVDGWLRTAVQAKYESVRPQIDQMKKARAQAQKKRDAE